MYEVEFSVSNWSRGMIPASGAGGPEFDSRIGPVELPFFSATLCSPYGISANLKLKIN